ncbi:MAG TPA: hypothetical protein VHJ59_05500 [Nitrososphaera sp.]|jgi:hypothetical protein|nr:hypothetical protein [Nitrososphaera sp.]
MKTAKFRKTFAIIGALLTAGLGIGLVSKLPLEAEATKVLN